MVAASVATAAQSEGRWLAELFGSTHSGGKYSIPTRAEPLDYLNEGADRIEEMGAGVLKLFLNDQPSRNYPNFTPSRAWPAVGASTPYHSLATMVAHPFYHEAIRRPAFRTVVFAATEFVRVNWRDGLSPNEEAAVVNEFQQLTEYLLTTFAADGKTFIIQNWEGDNLLNLDQFPNQATWPTMADGFVAYFKARQRGVEQGRAAVGAQSTSQVWNALEINYNFGAARPQDIPVPEEWTVLNRIVRDGYRDHGLLCDLYSWSAWSAKSPGEEYRITRGLDYMRARVPTTGPFGANAILLGEFGAYESSFFTGGSLVHSSSSDATFASVVLNQFSFAWRSGVQRAIFWQIYDNGLRTGVSFDYANPVSKTQQDLVGTWLIRPPGPPTHPNASYTTAHHQFASLMNCWLLEDDLSDFSLLHAQSGSWTVTTTPQSWAPHVTHRLSRTNTSPASLIYRTDGELVDWNITAFLYGATASNFRLRGYTSVDGVTWSSPFAFREIDSVQLDPAAPDWRRVFLGPNVAIPTGTRYLRVEINDTGAEWRTQLANVKIISRGLAPTIMQAPAAQSIRSGDDVTFTVAAEGRGPLRYRWLRNGVFVRETSTPALTLESAQPDHAGTYTVEVGNFAGFTASTPFTLTFTDNTFAGWRTTQFAGAQLDEPSVSGPDADPNRDGLPNLLAYALGRPALADATTPSPITTATITLDGLTHLTVSFAHRTPLDDVALTVEFASDLAGPWSANGLLLSSVTQDDQTLITVRDTLALEHTPRRFARLRAVLHD